MKQTDAGKEYLVGQVYVRCPDCRTLTLDPRTGRCTNTTPMGSGSSCRTCGLNHQPTHDPDTGAHINPYDTGGTDQPVRDTAEPTDTAR